MHVSLSLRALPISVYALLMAGLLFVALAAYAWFSYSEFQQVREDVDATSRREAERELRVVIDSVLADALALAHEFAAWEEVRQQLRRSQYYAYWHSHRMLQSNLLPGYVRDAELYSAAGAALAAREAGVLPPRVGPGLPAPQVRFHDGKPQLLVYDEVTNGDRRLGFVALQIAFLERVRAARPFRLVDPASIRFAAPPERVLTTWHAYVASADFALRESAMNAAVEQMLARTILHLGVILGCVVFLLFPVMVYLLARPLRAISQHIDHLRRGSVSGGILLNELSGVLPVAEAEKIKQSLNDYQERLLEVHSSLQEKSDELWRMAHHDPLTGVQNRRAYDEFLRNIPLSITERGRGVCFVLFDVNHFKAVNDTYGHQVGDAVLKTVAQAIASALQRGDGLFRIGGDEFALVLLDCNASDARRIAERCEQCVAASDYAALGIREPLQVSVGLAWAAPERGGDIGALQWQADVAMYHAKRPGRSRIVRYREEMARETQALFSSWINTAVADAATAATGLIMHYQPVVDLRRREVMYYESLARVRWQDELIMPRNIFPVVEARRLEVEMDHAVIATVHRDLSAGRIAPGTGVSINLSGPTVVHERLAELFAPFRHFLQDYRVVIEVTETALITQIGIATDNLEKLRGQGFQIALDDFGSGYSSLRYLTHMPVDTVKFDESLTQDILTSGKRRMLEHVVEMINEAGHTLVAEGIRNRAMLETAREVGFHGVQGHWICRPGEDATIRRVDFDSLGGGVADGPVT